MRSIDAEHIEDRIIMSFHGGERFPCFRRVAFDDARVVAPALVPMRFAVGFICGVPVRSFH